MFPSLILTTALVGQYGGYGHTGYNYSHQTYGQCYNHGHAQAYFQADPYHFTSVVASYVKAQATAQAAAQAQADLTVKLDRLTGTVANLDARIAAATAPPAAQATPYTAGATPYTAGATPYTATPHTTPAMPPPGAPPTPPVPAVVSPVAILERNRCAKCHTGSGSSGGFEIFAGPGQLVPLDEGSRTAILEAVMSGDMPPRKEGLKVSLADKRELLNLFLTGDAAK